jgi:hypothetical protein
MQRGITLIEHMILAAIVCIIGAIAIPAYEDYQAHLRLDEFASANNLQVDKSKRLRWRVATLTDGRKVDCKGECKFVTPAK